MSKTPRRQTVRRIAAASVAAAALIPVGLAALHFGRASAKDEAAPPPTPVDVARVVDRTITDWETYSGRLEATDEVAVRPLISGAITRVNFKDGALVTKGQVLFVIDQRPYEVALSKAEAELAAAQAQAGFSQIELDRAKALIGGAAIAQRDLDARQTAARNAAANVRLAQAAVAGAKLDLEYTLVRAPISGRASRPEITVGNVVAAGGGAAPLTTIVSISPVYAGFDADEQSYLRFMNAATRSGDVGLPVQLGLANETGFSRQGRIYSIDNQINKSSGTIRIRATFPNPDGVLTPGLYARVKVGGGAPHPALLIKSSAVGTDQDKKFVLVVGADNRVTQRTVELGAEQDGLRVIANGLKSGDRIVVDGVQAVRPGDKVAPHDVAMSPEGAAS
ncbi:MAG: efflux RND transporter periplasmic adaptor subunit [Caulobacter sp.]|nr:efflux RND transporter periplasmic adaptor subunit [Caulobacter sp.]